MVVAMTEPRPRLTNTIGSVQHTSVVSEDATPNSAENRGFTHIPPPKTHQSRVTERSGSNQQREWVEMGWIVRTLDRRRSERTADRWRQILNIDGWNRSRRSNGDEVGRRRHGRRTGGTNLLAAAAGATLFVTDVMTSLAARHLLGDGSLGADGADRRHRHAHCANRNGRDRSPHKAHTRILGATVARVKPGRLGVYSRSNVDEADDVVSAANM